MEKAIQTAAMTFVHHDVSNPENEVLRLRKEHSELKARLSELNSRLFLSPEEEIERKTIQKLKLIKKDRLAYLEGVAYPS